MIMRSSESTDNFVACTGLIGWKVMVSANLTSRTYCDSVAT